MTDLSVVHLISLRPTDRRLEAPDLDSQRTVAFLIGGFACGGCGLRLEAWIPDGEVEARFCPQCGAEHWISADRLAEARTPQEAA
ncbi:MAG: zinc ribbon domain-containing protein [Candidatus Dormibacteraeota bacterium]|nr:zinc ribbon domain-containing protein [Candidatus Dormibacteraeota bacterium]